MKPKRVVELTDKLKSGYWLDVHFIRGKTLRLFYPEEYATWGEEILNLVHREAGFGVILYTDDERPVWVYNKGLAAIEVIEAVPPEASCDDAAENTT